MFAIANKTINDCFFVCMCVYSDYSAIYCAIIGMSVSIIICCSRVTVCVVSVKCSGDRLHILFCTHDAFAAVNAATVASKMTIAAVNQACHRRRCC